MLFSILEEVPDALVEVGAAHAFHPFNHVIPTDRSVKKSNGAPYEST